MRNALKQFFSALVPYLAEVGAAATAALLAYAVFAFAVELALPHSVASVVSPQGLALATLVAALLALFGPPHGRHGWTRAVLTVVATAAAAFAAWWAAWYYFGPVPEARRWLAAAAAFAAGLLVAASRLRP